MRLFVYERLCIYIYRLGTLSPKWIRDSQLPLSHYAFIDCHIETMGWPDQSLSVVLVCEAPCVGELPDTRLVRLSRDVPAGIHLLSGHQP
jgi:hypothetical protein